MKTCDTFGCNRLATHRVTGRPYCARCADALLQFAGRRTDRMLSLLRLSTAPAAA